MAASERKTIKIALFKLEKIGIVFPDVYYQDVHASGAIRISEIVEIDFNLLDHDLNNNVEFISKSIAQIDAQIEALRANTAAEVDGLLRRKSELLAINNKAEQQQGE